LSRSEWKRWARDQRKMMQDTVKAQHGLTVTRDDDASDSADLEWRAVKFRRSIVRTSILVPTLFTVNAAVQGFPWFVFPSAILLLDVLGRAGALWADGISPIGALRRGWRARIRGKTSPAPLAPSLPPVDPATTLVPPDVLAGPQGDVVRRAVADRAFVQQIIGRLSVIEKDMLPDVTPTVDALVERVASLATTVTRLDADVSGSSLGALDERIAGLKRESTTPERERRLALLERQRGTLHDLLERRHALHHQLESASLALQNLKLDLLKLRSAGVSSALGDVTSATREARALSRDIENLLGAADDVRKL
jgi:hypothetical protein